MAFVLKSGANSDAIGASNKKRRPHTALGLLTSREQVGTPLSGVTRATRRWVVHVGDHRWSPGAVRNVRASFCRCDRGTGAMRYCSHLYSKVLNVFEG